MEMSETIINAVKDKYGSVATSGLSSTVSDLLPGFFLPIGGACVPTDRMARRLRIQYHDAIYHATACGNGRPEIVRDDADRDRFQEHLGRAAIRCGWHVCAFVIMPNHVHVVLKTPQPNLSRGMAFLSAYANGWSRRHRFGGHVSCSRGAIALNWWTMRPTSGR
jgi:hypothetical protein